MALRTDTHRIYIRAVLFLSLLFVSLFLLFHPYSSYSFADSIQDWHSHPRPHGPGLKEDKVTWDANGAIGSWNRWDALGRPGAEDDDRSSSLPPSDKGETSPSPDDVSLAPNGTNADTTVSDNSIQHLPHPLPPGVPNSPWSSTSKGPYAFVFYATDSLYACSALQMVHQLSILSPGVPVILMVPTSFSLSPNDGSNSNSTVFPPYNALPPFLAPFEKYNTTIVALTPPTLTAGGNMDDYYSSVLLKLLSFSLHTHLPHLKRIIVLDSDQTILKPLDHLFLLPPVDIAAPSAYWLTQPYITSTLLVVSLSDMLWEEMKGKDGLAGVRKNEYDMDLVNRMFFPKRILVLPGTYCVLNSHWGEEASSNVEKPHKKDSPFDPFLPPWSLRSQQRHKNNSGLKPLEALRKLREEEAFVVHYSSGGSGNKPWKVNMEWVRRRVKEGEADPWFQTLFEVWRGDAQKMCVGVKLGGGA